VLQYGQTERRYIELFQKFPKSSPADCKVVFCYAARIKFETDYTELQTVALTVKTASMVYTRATEREYNI